MIEVGVRELKARLSAYLAQVKAGETLVVTERGRPVARLTPAAPRSDLPDGWRRMIEEGRMVARGRPPRFGVPDVELLPGDGGRTMLDYLMEQRR